MTDSQGAHQLKTIRSILFLLTAMSTSVDAKITSTLTEYNTAYKVWNFSLKDVDGKTFSNKDLNGYWNVFGFGFTRCPDMCPRMMADLKRELAHVPKDFADKLRVYFVTLDPKYDTDKQLKSYIKAFKTPFKVTGITGNKSDLKTFAKNFSKPIYPEDPQIPGMPKLSPHEILHSGSFFVVGPQGKLRGVFMQPVTKKEVMFDHLAKFAAKLNLKVN